MSKVWYRKGKIKQSFFAIDSSYIANSTCSCNTLSSCFSIESISPSTLVHTHSHVSFSFSLTQAEIAAAQSANRVFRKAPGWLGHWQILVHPAVRLTQESYIPIIHPINYTNMDLVNSYVVTAPSPPSHPLSTLLPSPPTPNHCPPWLRDLA